MEDAIAADTDSDIMGNVKDDGDRDAMIVYTSGTTGPPKGAVLTSGNLTAQTSAIAQAWGWRKEVSANLRCLDKEARVN